MAKLRLGKHEVNAEYLDNGFYIISEATAKKLCNGLPLPRIGYARDFNNYTIQRTVFRGKEIWAVCNIKGKDPCQN